MIQIQAPDGSIVEFPDGTGDDTIKSVMQKSFPAQQQNPPPDQRWGWQKKLDEMGLQTMKDFSTGVMKGNIPFSDEIVAGAMTPIGMVKGAITGEDSGKGFMQRAGDQYNSALAFNRKTDKDAADRSPVANTLGQITGGVMTAGNLAKGGVTLLNPANPTVTNMATRGALESGLYGGIYGFGEGEGLQDRLGKGAWGLGLGLLTGGVTGAIAGKLSQNAAQKTIPTSSDLRAQAQTAYKAAEDAGVVFNPKSYGDAVDDWFSKAANHSLDPVLTPNSVAAFKRLEELKGMPLTLQTLEQQRRIFNLAAKQAAKASNDADAAIANATIRRIDEFVANNNNVLVSGGNPDAAASALKEARGLWRRATKSEQIADLITSAKEFRSQNYSQSGVDNALKTEFMPLVRDTKNMRGFTADEQAAIKRIVNSGYGPAGLTEKALRTVGKFAVRGPVSAVPTILTGISTGGVVGPALTMAAGEIGKQGATAMRMSSARLAEALIRSGGAMPQAQISPAQRIILQSLIAGGRQIPNPLQQAPAR